MVKWKCTVCNYIYDEEKEGKDFKDLSPSWVCPVCGAPKSAFVRIGKKRPKNKAVAAPTVAEKIIEQLSAIGVRARALVVGKAIAWKNQENWIRPWNGLSSRTTQ
jgi:pyruvate oxidase